MPNQVRVCRVCGKKYEACRTPKVSNAFRWQDVSCSPECGAEYLRKVQLSRGIISEDESDDVIRYNEEFNGFEGDLEDEYIDEFGSDA